MSDIHALSGAYALDALDDIERARFQRHLETCDTCQQEVDSFRETASLCGYLAEATPPASLRVSVLAGISTVRPLPPLPPVVARLERRRRGPTTLLAAAAAAVIIGAGAVTVQQVGDEPPSQVELVLAADDRQTFTKPLKGGAKATVIRSASLNRAVLVTQEMPPPPEGFAYVAWLEHDNVLVPAGEMPPGSDNTVLLAGDPASANGAGITLEPADVKHTEPLGDIVAVFDFGEA